jgi:hypothetical protein
MDSIKLNDILKIENLDSVRIRLNLSNNSWNALQLYHNNPELMLIGNLFNNEKNDLDELLINSIKLIAKAIKETDLHLRISFLIMVLESIFLRDEEDFKMENKCKRRISELMYPTDGKKYQALSELITSMYMIRHKMTHKSIRLYIELQQLREFQTSLIDSVIRIMRNKSKLKNKIILIEYLDRKVKTNA